MDTPNLIDKGTQAKSFQEQVQQSIPTIVRHLAVNISPQKELLSQETKKCSHVYTVTWTNILDLIINNHNASCPKQHRSAEDVTVRVAVTMPVNDTPSKPINGQNENKGGPTPNERIDIKCESIAKKEPIPDEDENEAENQDNDEDVNDGADNDDDYDIEEEDNDDDDSDNDDEDNLKTSTKPETDESVNKPPKQKTIDKLVVAVDKTHYTRQQGKANDQHVVKKHMSEQKAIDKPDIALKSSYKPDQKAETASARSNATNVTIMIASKGDVVNESLLSDSVTKVIYYEDMPKKSFRPVDSCPICKLSFQPSQRLIKHMRIHNPNYIGKLLCDICDMVFANRDKYASHLKAPGDNHGKHLCVHCEGTCKTLYGLRKHMQIDHPDKSARPYLYQCEVCQETFVTPETLKRHKRSHLRPDKFKCGKCDSFFETKVSLKSHRICVHAPIKSAGKRSIPWRKIPRQCMMHKCDICGVEFSTKTEMKRHNAKIHNIHEQHLCSYCGRVFKCKLSLQDHMTQHITPTPVLCDWCGKSFVKRSLFMRHISQHKAGPNAFPCSQCNKKFHDNWQRQLHVRAVHLKEKNYKCKFCPRRFFRCSNWKIHEKTHTGQKDYECTYCDFQFKTNYERTRHEKVHTNERSHVCDICKRGYTRKDKLKEHKIRIHQVDDMPADMKAKKSPVQCKTCGSVFKTKCSLVVHQKRHTGVKDKICNICGTAFINVGDLSRHKKIHLDGKIYPCKQCKVSFAKKAELNHHMLVHAKVSV